MSIKRHPMYPESAEYYDLIYEWKDYDSEAQRIKEWVQDAYPKAESILDVACGTGAHAQYFVNEFAYTGLDIHDRMVEIAAAKVPEANFVQGDMVSFDLGQQFDVVLCLFSSIGYVRTIDKLKQAIQCFRVHLKEGGVAIVEPWFTPDNWNEGYVHMTSKETESLKICRMGYSAREGDISIANMEYLIGIPGKGIVHKKERHELGLFTRQQMVSAFEEAGFEVTYDEVGLMERGMYICKAT